MGPKHVCVGTQCKVGGSDSLRLASLVSTEVTNCDPVVVDKIRSKPSKAALKQLSELNQRIYKTK